MRTTRVGTNAIQTRFRLWACSVLSYFHFGTGSLCACITARVYAYVEIHAYTHARARVLGGLGYRRRFIDCNPVDDTREISFGSEKPQNKNPFVPPSPRPRPRRGGYLKTDRSRGCPPDDARRGSRRGRQHVGHGAAAAGTHRGCRSHRGHGVGSRCYFTSTVVVIVIVAIISARIGGGNGVTL